MGRLSRLSRGLMLVVAGLLFVSAGRADAAETPTYYHLRQAVTFYIANTDGKAFDIDIDLKDINTFCMGPQTCLLKVYDPDGVIVHDEDLPDDGIENGGYRVARAGWDHELWAYGATRETGTEPMFRPEAFSDPRKIEKIQGTKRTVAVKKAKKGTYQVTLAGCDDHYVKISTNPGYKFGVLGHPDFISGYDDQFKTAYIYVPKPAWYNVNRKKMDVWVIELGYPRTRSVTFSVGNQPLTANNTAYKTTTTALTADQGLGRYEIPMDNLKPGTVFKMTTSGTGEFTMRLHGVPAILCPDEETAKFIGGGEIDAGDGLTVTFPWQRDLYASIKGLKKEDLTLDLQGGKWNQIATEDVNRMAWGTWQTSNTPGGLESYVKAINDAVAKTQPFSVAGLLANMPGIGPSELAFFYIYPIKGNGLYRSPQLKNMIQVALAHEWLKFRAGEVIYEPWELNVAYAQGFHWENWEPVVVMKEHFDPAFLKAIQVGAGNIAQRMYYANGLELVLSNGRTTVPMNIQNAYLITGDEKYKALSLRFLKRMVNAEDGPFCAGSKAGYFREHFGADGGYCTYPLYQLGRMYHNTGSPEAFGAMDRLCKWICYVTLPDGSGGYTSPTSWNSRIAMASIEHIWGNGFKYVAQKSEWGARIFNIIYGANPANVNIPDPTFEPGKPKPEKDILLLTGLTRNIPAVKELPADSATPFFEDLGDGHEFFCVRRGKYYAVMFAGTRPPWWMDRTLGGQNGYTGGGLAGLYVQGVGSTVLGRMNREYGWPAEAYNEMAIPVTYGEFSDGRIFNTGVARCVPTMDKANWTLKVTGEAIDAPVNFERSYQFNEANIAATIKITDAYLNRDVFQYREVFRKTPYMHVKSGWEIIPVMFTAETKATAFNAAGAAIGALAEAEVNDVAAVEVAYPKGSIRIAFDKPRTVRLSAKPNPAHVHGHAADARARGVQVKYADKLENGASAELRYTITPSAK